jgi:proline dehydrogenase
LLQTSESLLGRSFVSALLRRTIFPQFCGAEDSAGLNPLLNQLDQQGIGAILDYAAEAPLPALSPSTADAIDYAGFQHHLETFLECIRAAGKGAHNSGRRGLAAVKVSALGPMAILERPDPSSEQWIRLIDRLREVAREAVQHDVIILIDAEQTYVQNAIDQLVQQLQLEFNQDKPVVWGTYQLYRVDALKRLQTDLDHAQSSGYHFGAKLVRGAYLIEERARAQRLNYSDPIHATVTDTHHAYDQAVRLLLQSSSHVMIASHNQQSCQHALEQLTQADASAHQRLFFAQLLGMGDLLTYPLAQHQYQVYKYVPYGPIHQVLPYLLRRAEENADLLASNVSERQHLRQEVRRRLLRPFA